MAERFFFPQKNNNPIYRSIIFISLQKGIVNTSTLLLMEGTRRADIQPGITVMVELVEDKRTGRLTGGKVKEILTSAPTHPHGIKVMLENGLVGRIKQIL